MTSLFDLSTRRARTLSLAFSTLPVNGSSARRIGSHSETNPMPRHCRHLADPDPSGQTDSVRRDGGDLAVYLGSTSQTEATRSPFLRLAHQTARPHPPAVHSRHRMALLRANEHLHTAPWVSRLVRGPLEAVTKVRISGGGRPLCGLISKSYLLFSVPRAGPRYLSHL